jgi:Mycothiol maleylpyruvate isomerase N-terminal domain
MTPNAEGWARTVEGVVAELRTLLGALTPGQWEAAAAHVGWTCWRTAEHIAGDFAHYAGQVIGAPRGRYVAYGFDTSRASAADELVEVVAVAGGLLAAAVRTSDPGSLGWHPHGYFTPTGFAAIGAAEGLVHGHDIATGAGVPFTPAAANCERVLAATFPAAAPGPSAFDALLRETGRGPQARTGNGPAPRWSYRAAAAADPGADPPGRSG